MLGLDIFVACLDRISFVVCTNATQPPPSFPLPLPLTTPPPPMTTIISFTCRLLPLAAQRITHLTWQYRTRDDFAARRLLLPPAPLWMQEPRVKTGGAAFTPLPPAPPPPMEYASRAANNAQSEAVDVDYCTGRAPCST